MTHAENVVVIINVVGSERQFGAGEMRERAQRARGRLQQRHHVR